MLTLSENDDSASGVNKHLFCTRYCRAVSQSGSDDRPSPWTPASAWEARMKLRAPCHCGHLGPEPAEGKSLFPFPFYVILPPPLFFFFWKGQLERGGGERTFCALVQSPVPEAAGLARAPSGGGGAGLSQLGRLSQEQ